MKDNKLQCTLRVVHTTFIEYDFLQTCVFGKQSLGLVTVTPFVRRHPFS